MKPTNLPQEQHRLFVACPIPMASAVELRDWAAEALHDMRVRLVSPEQMHVTLMFFPSVSSEKRDELVDLITKVEWVPIHTTAVRLCTHRRNAVAIDLDVPTVELDNLEDRLGRASWFMVEGLENQMSLNSQPLARLALSQAEPELDKLRRRNRTGSPLQLHVTIGRAGKSWALSKHQLNVPSFELVLDRIALYESMLLPEGAVYKRISTPV